MSNFGTIFGLGHYRGLFFLLVTPVRSIILTSNMWLASNRDWFDGMRLESMNFFSESTVVFYGNVGDAVIPLPIWSLVFSLVSPLFFGSDFRITPIIFGRSDDLSSLMFSELCDGDLILIFEFLLYVCLTVIKYGSKVIWLPFYLSLSCSICIWFLSISIAEDGLS